MKKKTKKKSLTDLQGNTYRVRKQSLSLCRLKRYLYKKEYFISKKTLETLKNTTNIMKQFVDSY